MFWGSKCRTSGGGPGCLGFGLMVNHHFLTTIWENTCFWNFFDLHREQSQIQASYKMNRKNKLKGVTVGFPEFSQRLVNFINVKTPEMGIIVFSYICKLKIWEFEPTECLPAKKNWGWPIFLGPPTINSQNFECRESDDDDLWNKNEQDLAFYFEAIMVGFQLSILLPATSVWKCPYQEDGS